MVTETLFVYALLRRQIHAASVLEERLHCHLLVVLLRKASALATLS